MLSSSRFVVAVHVMSLLAHYGKKGPVCSAVIAKSVDTNPVVIRRLMSELEGSGLVQSTSGRAGGFVLAKAPGEINLAEIYQAVEDEQVFRVHRNSENPECETAKAIFKSLMPRLADASKAMSLALAQIHLSEIVPQQAVEVAA
jgi:Rrf2 family protein